MENRRLKKENGRVWTGIILLGIGAVLLLSRMGFPFPKWLFEWPVILILVGLFVGVRNRFHNPAWIVLVLIGSFFLIDNIEPDFRLSRFTWPIIIIALGIGFLIRPRHSRYPEPLYPMQGEPVSDQKSYTVPEIRLGQENKTQDEYLDAVAIFGATRKIIVSKTFKGGDLVSLFGGHEVDLRQADIQGKVVLDVTQIFGGTKLLLPSSWNVKSEMVALMGGIEDKRQMASVTIDPEKVLILKGTSIFGGIDIRNY